MFDPKLLLVLCPALPLLAAVLTALLGPRWLRQQSHWLAIVAIGGALLCSLGLLQHLRAQVGGTDAAGMIGYEETVSLWTWADVPDAYQPADRSPVSFHVEVALRLDALTAVMLVTVNLVALLVAIYSSGYMQGDRGYWRFFSFVSLFVFSMNTLVTASNFLLLFVCWEGVGLCSYLLIGFWYQRPAAAAAGKKAFLVNRVGDFGFMLAMFLIFVSYGTLDLHDTAAGPGVLGQTRLADGSFVGGAIGLAICLLLLLGACGKSAQLPLHVWLADAMEGPTPVSALIHAATMVTAGVYLVARCTPLFVAAPAAQLVVAVVGGVTALMAGIIALTQFDLKRILAYSTISQLGYMFLGLGAGTWAGVTAGMFHLFTHAFFKALLFLGAGSVMHAMGNEIDVRRFGGLRRIMPHTHWTFAVGCLALAGIVPFAGFWSKDAILASVRDQSQAMQMAAASTTHVAEETTAETGSHAAPHGDPSDHHAVATGHLAGRDPSGLRQGARIYGWLYYLGLGTAFLTAIYTFRAFYLTFYGPLQVPPQAGDHAHESPPVMWIPLAILAVFAAGIGWLMHAGHVFAEFLAHTPSLAISAVRQSPSPYVFHPDVALWSTVIAVAGVGLASYFFLGSLREAELLRRLFSRPITGGLYYLSRGKFYFDELYSILIVRPLAAVAQGFYWLDRYLVDGLFVDGTGALPRWLGGMLRGWQRGLTSYYGLWMIVGVVALVGIQLWWGG